MSVHKCPFPDSIRKMKATPFSKLVQIIDSDWINDLIRQYKSDQGHFHSTILHAKDGENGLQKPESYC